MPNSESSHPPATKTFGFTALRDEVLLSLCRRALIGRVHGRLTLTLPSGRSRTFGSNGHHAILHLHSLSVVSETLRRGTIGFAESYLRGDIETPDLGDVFRFFIDNRAALDSAGQGFFRVRRSDISYHANRDNSRQGSRENVAAHYDLGNDFYAHWLDPGMAYSSGLYLTPDMTLEDAQSAKFREVIRALEVSEGDRILEIGCGWGGFIEAAAQRGAHVDAITVSRRQLEYTQERIRRSRLGNRATVRFEDYRDTRGSYDAIASIEMIEAVGEPHWSAYFKTLFDRLRPGGIAAVQAITIRDESYALYRERPDFIQRYIFPGGMLPTKKILAQKAAECGLTYRPWKEFGASYARTLSTWRQRFHEQWPQIKSLDFDERFRRLWDYYLTYCEVGFEKGVIDVGIYTFRRPEHAP